MKVVDVSNGRIGIALGGGDPAATLDIGGDLRIGTVNDLSGETAASVLVLDAGLVKKRQLPTNIWDGDDNDTYTGENPISISTGNVISVGYDNQTIKMNTSNELYVDEIPASAGWTYYPSSQMVIEGSDIPSSAFFRWYSHSELGLPATARAVYLHIAMSNGAAVNYNLSVTEQAWTDSHQSLGNAIASGDFLTATVNNTRPATNAGIVKLNTNGVYIGLRGMDTGDPLDFCRIKVMGYFE